MLGTFDLGSLLGMPLAGTVAFYAPRCGLPAFPTMFLTIGAAVVAVAAYYALETQPASDR